jgi:phage baseplate assembly protein V
MSASFTIAELERRLLNMIRFGMITSVDLNSATCRVKLDDTHTTGDLPWSVQRAGNVRTWSPLSVGEQVMIISPAGDLTQGVVVPSLYQNAHPAPSNKANEHITDYGDGTVITYDTTAHKLRIECTAAVEVIAPLLELGDVGGAAVARVGDLVAVGAGSSAGQWPIVTGSNKVNAG